MSEEVMIMLDHITIVTMLCDGQKSQSRSNKSFWGQEPIVHPFECSINDADRRRRKAGNVRHGPRGD